MACSVRSITSPSPKISKWRFLKSLPLKVVSKHKPFVLALVYIVCCMLLYIVCCMLLCILYHLCCVYMYILPYSCTWYNLSVLTSYLLLHEHCQVVDHLVKLLYTEKQFNSHMQYTSAQGVNIASFPGAPPSLCHLQYDKSWGRAWERGQSQVPSASHNVKHVP